jgi:hypothetical protein
VTHVIRVLPPALAPPRVGEHPQLDDNDSRWLLLESSSFWAGTKFFKLKNQLARKIKHQRVLGPPARHSVVVVPTR